METEDLVVNEGGEWKVVEEVSEVFPDICIPVFPKAFVVEPVDLSDLSRLVIATEDGKSLWVSNLEGNKESDGFDRVVASINVVSCRIRCISEWTLAGGKGSAYP